MSLRSKAKAEKKREQLRLQREREVAAVNARVAELMTRTAGFARSPRPPEMDEAYNRAKIPVYARQNKVHHVGTLHSRFDMSVTPKKPVVVGDGGETSEELMLREVKALERTREIQKRVDVAFNKGGLQLLSEGEFEAMRKGELRRRS